MAEVKYEEESSAAYGEQAARTWTYAYAPDEAPDHIDFSGICPKCDHDSAYRWPLYVVREDLEPEPVIDGDTPATMVAPDETVVVRCQCTRAHPGSGGEKGCGRYWRLTVPGR